MIAAAYTFAVLSHQDAAGPGTSKGSARCVRTVSLIGLAVLCLLCIRDPRLSDQYVAHYSDRSMTTGYLLTLFGAGGRVAPLVAFLLSITRSVCAG